VHEKIALGMPSIHDSAEFSRVLKIEECRERVVKMTFLIFALSLAALLIAARFFTLAAEQVGRKLGYSPLVTGLVIVAIGTSLPELAASVSAARSSQSELISVDLLGASISNILLVLGKSACFISRPIIDLLESA
jgi:cation:H+ antiporter